MVGRRTTCLCIVNLPPPNLFCGSFYFPFFFFRSLWDPVPNDLSPRREFSCLLFFVQKSPRDVVLLDPFDPLLSFFFSVLDSPCVTFGPSCECQRSVSGLFYCRFKMETLLRGRRPPSTFTFLTLLKILCRGFSVRSPFLPLFLTLLTCPLILALQHWALTRFFFFFWILSPVFLCVPEIVVITVPFPLGLE